MTQLFFKTVRIIAIIWASTYSICNAEDPKRVFEGSHSKDVHEVKEDLQLLYKSLISFLKNNEGVWPQLPDELRDQDEVIEWWQAKLEPFGMPKDRWLHSSITDESFQFTYSPMMFSSEPLKAFEWSNMPWAVAVGLFKGENVSYSLMPDGSIHVYPFDQKPSSGPAKIPKSLKSFVPLPTKEKAQ